jgi:hypothetical protein
VLELGLQPIIRSASGGSIVIHAIIDNLSDLRGRVGPKRRKSIDQLMQRATMSS